MVLRSLHALIQQTAYYVSHGYYFYHAWTMNPLKVEKTDSKILELYPEANFDKYKKSRLKKEGFAKLSYLRYGQHCILLSTAGKSTFLEREKFKDAREISIPVGDYTVFMGQKLNVKVSKARFAEYRAYFDDIAVKRKAETLKEELVKLFPRQVLWGGVRRQIYTLIKHINEKRNTMGRDKVEWKIPTRLNVRIYESMKEQVDRQVREAFNPAGGDSSLKKKHKKAVQERVEQDEELFKS